MRRGSRSPSGTLGDALVRPGRVVSAPGTRPPVSARLGMPGREAGDRCGGQARVSTRASPAAPDLRRACSLAVRRPDLAAADSEVMSSAADGVTHHAEQCQDGADNQDNDADRPDNSDFRDETDDKKDYAENDQGDS